MTAGRTLLATLAAFLVLPGSALAATATVTGDDGNPVALSPAGPVSIRNMAVQVVTTVSRGETPFYTAQVLDPAGAPASAVSPCRSTRNGPRWASTVSYHGNGTYTLSVKRYANAGCATATSEQTLQYAVGAGTSVGAPTGPLMTREANSDTAIPHQLPVTPNPGATSYEVRYARNGAIGADGGISGASGEAFVDPTSHLADLRFTTPGAYVIVGRAKTADGATPWSPALRVKVLAPFDLASTKFPDVHGPRYALRSTLRESFARGRVTIAAARGRKGGRFHRLGRPRLSTKGRLTLHFTLHKPGLYRLRFVFRGSSLVAPGRATQLIRIR